MVTLESYTHSADGKRPSPIFFRVGIPIGIRSILQFVCWRFGPVKPNGRRDKVPVDPRTGRNASVTDPGTWADFETASRGVTNRNADGVGLVLTSNLNLTAIDIDGCVDPLTGTIDADAAAILESFRPTYAEISPSGTGLRILTLGQLLGEFRKRRGSVEAYSNARFVTLTGNRLESHGFEVADCSAELLAFGRQYLSPAVVPARDVPELSRTNGDTMADDELLDRATLAAGTGTRFAALFAGNLLNHPSQSEADFELCRMLLWWTGGDLERADALFRRSGLYRSKWDRHGYSNRTLSAALASLNGRYYVPGSSSCPPGAGCGSSRVLPFEQDRCVDKECSDSTSPESLIVRYIREIQRRTGRAVGLSVRQAGELIGKHFTNAANILRKMFLDGELIAVSTGNYGNRLASEFDLPEFERVQVDPESPKSSNADPQTVRNAPVPYTFPPRKPGPFKPIWVWSSRYAAWQNLGIYDPAVIPTVYLEYLKRFRMAEWWIVGEQLIQRPKNGVRGTRSRPIPAVAAANK